MTRLLVLSGLAAAFLCGCHRRGEPVPERAQPVLEPVPARAALPTAPAPRLKPPTVVARSVKPTDDSATASKGFVAVYGLTLDDAVALGKLPGVTGAVPIKHIPAEVRHLDRMTNARVVATVAAYADVHALKLSAGRFLTADDDKENVCVLGAKAAEDLFPFEKALDQEVIVKNHTFKVIGVVSARQADVDHDVCIPLQTSRARFGETIIVRGAGTRTATKVELSEIVLRVTDPDRVRPVAEHTRRALASRHAKLDWEVVPNRAR